MASANDVVNLKGAKFTLESLGELTVVDSFAAGDVWYLLQTVDGKLILFEESGYDCDSLYHHGVPVNSDGFMMGGEDFGGPPSLHPEMANEYRILSTVEGPG